MPGFASLIERVFKKPAPPPPPAPLPVISLQNKLRMVAALLDNPASVTVARDDASREAVSLANGLADVFTRAGWRVTPGALTADGTSGVTLALADPGNLTLAERGIVSAWTAAELGPLQQVQGEPGSDPEFRILGQA